MASSAPPTTALHHLAELRRRVLICAVVMLVGSCLGFVFREPVIALLQRPLGEDLFYTTPQGGFDFVVRVSMLIGLFLTLPVAVYNLLRFIEPALSRPLGRRLPIVAVTASATLTVAGAAFAYVVALPAALHFFAGIGSPTLHALIGADRYFSFVLGYLATFAVVFHLPLVLLLINHVTPLGPGSLTRWRKWVILGSFAVALVIPSAPDPLSQVILAIPLISLYELSTLLVWLANRRRQTVAGRAGPTTTPPLNRSAHTVSAPAPSAPASKDVTQTRGPQSTRAVPKPTRRISTSAGVLDLSQAVVSAPPVPRPQRRNDIIDLRQASR